ncbi:MAG TPA: hypothetical protein VGU61_19810 [Noviherbaspirillum sp.]|jgi:hypothetical protein|uniref:hypothetical protein n=1 Tax=Noviherbaspirillum sp. TaxID=1926288 RepID=UPI002DDDB0FF|nr:hypothetical protein [Noviherbaspirillum sp.]HEV2612518.1 hypothetical protein [Noviherbaspirillum sp.]
MAVAETSIERYRQLAADGELGPQQQKVLAAMKPGVQYTRAELSKLTGFAINVITGRVNELIHDEKRLEECDIKKCPVTGYKAKTVMLAPAEGG